MIKKYNYSVFWVVGHFDCGGLSVAFQLLNLPCLLSPLPRDRNERSFYVRILRLRSQTLTFFRLVQISLDASGQMAAFRFSKSIKPLTSVNGKNFPN